MPTICAKCKFSCHGYAGILFCHTPSVIEYDFVNGQFVQMSCHAININGHCEHYVLRQPWYKRWFKNLMRVITT